MEKVDSDIILREKEKRRKKNSKENERRKRRVICDGCKLELSKGYLNKHKREWCVNRIIKNTII